MKTTSDPLFDLYFEPAQACGHAVRVHLYERRKGPSGDERGYAGAVVLSVANFKRLFLLLHEAGVLGAADGDFGEPHAPKDQA